MHKYIFAYKYIHVLPTRVIVNLGVMVMKRCFTVSRSLKLEPHLFSDIL